MQRIASLLLICSSCFFLAQNAFAGFDITPITATLSSSGQGATISYTVTNFNDTKLAVQIMIVPREPDQNGKEDYKESPAMDELFRIFPNQLILDPKATRTVRVTYIGTPKVDAEKAFRIISEELPIDLDDPKRVYTKPTGKVTLSTRYVGSLYVAPKDGKSDLIIEAKKSEKNLILTILNKGLIHQVIRKPIVKIVPTAGGKEVELPEGEITPLLSQNILAGHTRVYVLSWPKDLAEGPVKVTLDPGKE